MVHVWLTQTPCGPFAGIDEGGPMCDGHAHGH
jgi:hypothetical protein